MLLRRSLSLGVLALAAGVACSSTGPVAKPTPMAPPTYTAYVLGQSDGSLTPISLASGVAGSPMTVGAANKVWGIAITKDGKMAYVTGGGNITPVNLVSKTVLAPILVDASDFGPIDIALSHDEKTAYVLNYSAYKVTAVTLATGAVGTPIMVGAGDTHPSAIVITPDGKTAYVVVNSLNSTTKALDIKGGLVPIDLRTNQAGAQIPIGHEVGGMVLAANGKTAYAFYLTADATGKLILTVAAIELPSGKVGALIPITFFANSLALSADGKTIYMVQQLDFAGGESPQAGMAALDLVTGELGPVTVLRTHPQAIAIGRDAH